VKIFDIAICQHKLPFSELLTKATQELRETLWASHVVNFQNFLWSRILLSLVRMLHCSLHLQSMNLKEGDFLISEDFLDLFLQIVVSVLLWLEDSALYK